MQSTGVCDSIAEGEEQVISVCDGVDLVIVADVIQESEWRCHEERGLMESIKERHINSHKGGVLSHTRHMIKIRWRGPQDTCNWW
jgi:hypothetical protein